MSDTDETAARAEPTADVADTSTSADITATSADISLPSAPPTPGQKRRGRRALLIASLIVVVLAACGFGSYSFVAQQYNQLNALGAQMCANLEKQQYDSLYQHFSDDLKSRFTKAEFSHFGSEIDTYEGKVLSCGQSEGNHFSIDLGEHAITVASLVNREASGTHSGNVRFQFTGNSWTVDGFDAGFLGVSLDALKLADNYCTALENNNFQDIYQMLAPSVAGASEQQFAQVESLHAQVDQAVIDCSLAGIGPKNTDTSASLSLHVYRLLHNATGTITLQRTPRGWVITAIESSIQGRDLAPFLLTQRWCNDIHSQNYVDAFGLLSSEASFGNSAQTYATEFTGKSTGIKWLDCTPDPTTYRGDSNVLVRAAVVQERVKTQTQVPVWIQFALKQENSAWKIDVVLQCALYRCAELDGR